MLKCDAALISLLQHSPAVYCAVVNRHAEPQASRYLLQNGYQTIQCLPFTCFSSSAGAEEHFPPSPQTEDKLLYYYAMDMASLSPVLALDPQAGDTVLDMCAAPGGKAFAILQLVKAGGAVALNDCSASRVRRLNDVVQKCVAKGLNHSVRITKRRGEDWSRIEKGVYDRVLVDAPCSADRHNIGKWTENKKNIFWPDTIKFRKLQQSLLLSALQAVKSQGTVVYSTCTLSTQENDVVVSEAIECARKLGYQVEAVPPMAMEQELEETLFGEVKGTEFGKLIMPSTSTNIGPMYLSKLYVTS